MTDSDWGLKLLKSSQTKKAKFHAMNAMARKIKFEILVYTMIFFAIFYFIKKIWSHSF